MDIVKSVEHEQLKNKIPDLKVGDTVRVHQKIKEGNRQRIQVFEGIIIKKQNGGVNASFTVRKISYGVGVEKTFLVHSPLVEKVEVVRVGKARRAKLYYLRDKVGKAAKTKENTGARIEDKEIKMRKSRGITLIVLVVTIVVLLILAGITINTVVGDKGLISRASDAKVQMEIANEKEIVARAESLTVIRTKDTEISYEIFEPALQEEAGGNNVEASDAGDVIDVLFPDTNRYYEVDKNGNITGPNEVVNDENAGDITKGGRCDGSEEKPYEICCIEDLVMLANRTNGKGNYIDEKGELKDATVVNNPFRGKNFILTRTLNFESKYSYSKPEIKWSYDSENDAYKIDETSTKTLKELITNKEGVGFVPISPITGSPYLMFQGNLDGKGYTIKNLYENRTDKQAGLFGTSNGNVIKNLKLTGNIKAPGQEIGAFVFRTADCKIYNCYNLVNINDGSNGAGFVSHVMGNITLINCYSRTNNNRGLITFDDVNGTTTIVNCYNMGTSQNLNHVNNGSWRIY